MITKIIATKYINWLIDKQKKELSGESMEEHLEELQLFINSQQSKIDKLENDNRTLKFEFESNKRLLQGFAYFKMGGDKPS